MKNKVIVGSAVSLALSLALLTAPAVFAQTTDTTGTTYTTGTSNSSSTGTTSPGLPNTGAGGDAATNAAILLSTGLIAVGGATLLARRFAF